MPLKKAPAITVARAADIFRLLADRTRIRILLYLLEQEEAFAGQVGAAVGTSQPATSHHLALLLRGGLVERRRDGKQNFYRVSSPVVVGWLRGVTEGESSRA